MAPPKRSHKHSNGAMQDDAQADRHASVLTKFHVHDSSQRTQSLEALSQNVTLYLNGTANGRRVKNLGPVESWTVELDGADDELIRLCTSESAYKLKDSPSSSYRSIYNPLKQKVILVREIARLLRPGSGKHSIPEASVKEVAAALARSQGATLGRAMENISQHADFILHQFEQLDRSRSNGDMKGKSQVQPGKVLRETQFAKELVDNYAAQGKDDPKNKGDDAKDVEQLTADQAMAERLQYEEQRKQRRKEEKERERLAKSVDNNAATSYLQVSFSEIADEYPKPTEYKRVEGEEEHDELLVVDEGDEGEMIDPFNELPTQRLDDFAIYDNEGLYSTLELLPMSPGVRPYVELYASGLLVQDVRDWSAGGQPVDDSREHLEGGAVAGSNEGCSSSQGLRIYLSQIREWYVECGAGLIFLTIRTNSSWYRLLQPSEGYRPWYEPVVRSIRWSMKLLNACLQDPRPARLSLDHVVKALVDEQEQRGQKRDAEGSALPQKKGKGSDKERAKREEKLQQYLVKHGQIILNQFSQCPVRKMKDAHIAMELRDKLLQLKHVRLDNESAKELKGTKVNRNPIHHLKKQAKSMFATMTPLVHDLWKHNTEISEGTSGNCEHESSAKEVNALPERRGKSEPVKLYKPCSEDKENGLQHYWAANIGHSRLHIGTAIKFAENDVQMKFGVILSLFRDPQSRAKARARVFVHGRDTVLGNAAREDELFCTSLVSEVSLEKQFQRTIQLESVQAKDGQNFGRETKDVCINFSNGEGFIWRFWWFPEKGMFSTWSPSIVDNKQPSEMNYRAGKDIDIRPGDAVYISTEAWPPLSRKDQCMNGGSKTDETAKKKGGAQENGSQQDDSHETDSDFDDDDSAEDGASTEKIHETFGVAIVEKIDARSGMLTLRRFVKPEELIEHKGWEWISLAARKWEVFYDGEMMEMRRSQVVRKCQVVLSTTMEGWSHTFVCSQSIDTEQGKFGPLPTSAQRLLKPTEAGGQPQKCQRLRTLDIFAGCGGLSKGLEEAGIAQTKWALEHDEDSCEAFKLNHPTATTFSQNCNVLLYAALKREGCLEGVKHSELASCEWEQLSENTVAMLPKPEDVDLMCGGPPCQGFSGMNRFARKNSLWSAIQNEMILAYLSFADLYRPKYFLLENVKNFLSFNKGLTFRMTVRSLLEMGYQVRFAALNAAHYGIGQTRRRAFLFAALPGYELPEWPQPETQFTSTGLEIKYPNGDSFAAVTTSYGFPLPSVTVRDMISDLPPIENGADESPIEYSKLPESAFQRQIRQGSEKLHDHVCKALNEVNFIRCALIPPNSDKDWRVFQETTAEHIQSLAREGRLPSEYIHYSKAKEVIGEGKKGEGKVVPWCLPHTAARHNQWRGLFSRLQWGGYFPTSTTDPNPMGKVGQVFHPDQDRIVSVRECARSQGFPDTFQLCGSIGARHQQVGNAVPVPLAHALGRELLTAHEASIDERT